VFLTSVSVEVPLSLPQEVLLTELLRIGSIISSGTILHLWYRDTDLWSETILALLVSEDLYPRPVQPRPFIYLTNELPCFSFCLSCLTTRSCSLLESADALLVDSATPSAVPLIPAAASAPGVGGCFRKLAKKVWFARYRNCLPLL
jgi:hypothetical protein